MTTYDCRHGRLPPTYSNGGLVCVHLGICDCNFYVGLSASPGRVSCGVDFVVLWDIPETLQKAALHLRPILAQYGYLIASLLLVSFMGLITDKRIIHAVIGIAWLLLVLGYELISSAARIFAHFA